MWAAAGTRSPETTKQIQSANSGLLTRLKHSDAGTGLLVLHQDQDPLRHGDKRVIENSTVGSQTYLSCLSLPLSLMRSSQPRPPLGPKPTNSVGWTNTWLALPLMRFMLMSRAADQQTASTLIRPFYTEYTCCLPKHVAEAWDSFHTVLCLHFRPVEIQYQCRKWSAVFLSPLS